MVSGWPQLWTVEKITSAFPLTETVYFWSNCSHADRLRDERQPRRHCVATNQATERLRLSGQNGIASLVSCETFSSHRDHQTDANIRDVITPWLPHIRATRISSSHTSRPHSHAARRVRPHRKQETHAASIQSASIVVKKNGSLRVTLREAQQSHTAVN